MGGFVSGKNKSEVVVINALELEKVAGRQGQLAHRLMYADLVILEDLSTDAE